MLKGIILNEEIQFVDINKEIKGEIEELVSFDNLLDYCCEVGDCPENEWILIKDDIIKIEDEDIIRVIHKE